MKEIEIEDKQIKKHFKEHYLEILDDVAAQSSKTESTAEEAEREVEKMKKVEFMEKKFFKAGASLSGSR